jgi:hypothetical protein
MLSNLLQTHSQLFAFTIKPTKLFILSFGLCILIGYFFHYIELFYFPEHAGTAPFSKGESKQYIIVVSSIFAPIVETCLFQLLPFYLLKKAGINNQYLLLFLPAMLFGYFHTYHPLYQVAAFTCGLVFNYTYIWYRINYKYAFVLVALLHSAYNLYGTLFVV